MSTADYQRRRPGARRAAGTVTAPILQQAAEPYEAHARRCRRIGWADALAVEGVNVAGAFVSVAISE